MQSDALFTFQSALKSMRKQNGEREGERQYHSEVSVLDDLICDRITMKKVYFRTCVSYNGRVHFAETEKVSLR